MKKNYTHPELEAFASDIIDVLTFSLGILGSLTEEKGSDPSVNDNLDF
ncbi:MAG: hypothetical protein J6A83_07235 [Clostridia bacterium]|nr:hypothetical protein [Clostridia bacterium]